MESVNAPESDAHVPAWIQALGLPGIVDLHVHFMPERVQQKVWEFFDRAGEQRGPDWPIAYRQSDAERLEALRAMGLSAFSTLNYAHRPGMAQWLNDYSTDMARAHHDVIHSATFYPEPGVDDTVEEALNAGAKVFKIHIQVGGFSPTDPQLDGAWARVAEAQTPVVIHCGNGPHPGEHTGIAPIRELLRRHPSLLLVIAHAGLPDYLDFADLAAHHPNVYLDTTMVGTDFMEQIAPMPEGYIQRLAELDGKVVLGSDFPSIPYQYSHQLAVLNSWGLSDEWLADTLWHTPRKLIGASQR
ncbi:MAG: amidohydrolase family protein [Nesterenkonia sp.]